MPSVFFLFPYVEKTVNTFSGGFPQLSNINAFSPNNDGINDIWYCYDDQKAMNSPYSYNANRYILEIYNRWGQLLITKDEVICSSFTNGAINWDGKFNGSDVPEAVYYYILRLSNCTYPQGLQVKDGSITIIR